MSKQNQTAVQVLNSLQNLNPEDSGSEDGPEEDGIESEVEYIDSSEEEQVEEEGEEPSPNSSQKRNWTQIAANEI